MIHVITMKNVTSCCLHYIILALKIEVNFYRTLLECFSHCEGRAELWMSQNGVPSGTKTPTTKHLEAFWAVWVIKCRLIGEYQSLLGTWSPTTILSVEAVSRYLLSHARLNTLSLSSRPQSGTCENLNTCIGDMHALVQENWLHCLSF